MTCTFRSTPWPHLAKAKNTPKKELSSIHAPVSPGDVQSRFLSSLMEPPEVAGRARGSRDLAKVRAPAPFARLLVVWRGEVLGRPTIQNLFSKKSKYAREHFFENFKSCDGRWVYEKRERRRFRRELELLVVISTLRAVKRRRS